MISKVQKRFWYSEMWFHLWHYIDLQCFQCSIWQGRNSFPNTATTLADLGESADLKSHVQCVNLLGQTYPKSHNHNLFFYSFNNSWLTYCNHLQKTRQRCVMHTLFSRVQLWLSDSEVQGWVLVSHEKFAEHGILSSCTCSGWGNRRCFQQALVLCAIGRTGVLSRASFWGIFSSKLSDHPLHDLAGH